MKWNTIKYNWKYKNLILKHQYYTDKAVLENIKSELHSIRSVNARLDAEVVALELVTLDLKQEVEKINA